MNMVLGLGRLDLSNIQQQQQQAQQANELNQLNQINQLNQLNQINQINQINQLNQMNQNQQLSNLQQQQNAQQQEENLLIQQQQQQQAIVQPINQQAQLPGYFIAANNVTPLINNNTRPICDHNNNAINLTSLNQFDRDEQQLNEQLTTRIISPSTQSETSTNTQISKKIGIRIGSPPPEMEFKYWTLPRYIQQPQPLTQTIRYTPNTQRFMNYETNNQFQNSIPNQSSADRKQFNAQQFASQIIYNKQNRLSADLDSPQSASHSDLLLDDQQQQSVTPSNLQSQQFYNYPASFEQNQASLADSYAKFAKYCYETKTHKIYTIPGNLLI